MRKRLKIFVFAVIIMLFSATALVSPTVWAQNCDPNDIMACGASTRSQLSQKTTGDIVGIYAHYGIQKSHFGSLVEGTVYKDGRIVVGGRTVATGARSTGRYDMPGSTAVNAGGVRIYERPTDVSFRSDSLSAFVRMVNGRFQYAIIKSCGNPTKGNPTPQPEKPANPGIEIQKDVSKEVVEVGEVFNYRIRVRNTGDVDLVNAHVYDRAPANIEFVPGSGSGGSTVTKTEFKVTIPLLKKGESRTYSFRAKFTTYVANIVNNQACVLTEKPPLRDCDTAGNRPKKPPVEKPEEPEVPEVPETPITPVVYTKELPNTGPAEIIGSAMGLSSTTYGAISYARSRRGLKALLFRK